MAVRGGKKKKDSILVLGHLHFKMWLVCVPFLKASDEVVNHLNCFLPQLQNGCLALGKIRAQNRMFPRSSIKYSLI